MADVLVVGELLAEIMADKVGQRFDTPGVFLGPYPSGAPGIFIDQVANMGVSSSMIACVGKDGFGDLIINRLKRDGVDISQIRRSDKLPTGTAFVTYREDGSREFIFNIGNSAAGLLDESMIASSDLPASCKFFHVMGSFLSTESARAIIFKGIEKVKAAGGKISFDPNVRPELLNLPGTKEALQKVLAVCSVFLPSDLDLKVLFGSSDEAACAKKVFADYPVEMMVVKQAVKGATFMDRERKLHHPAFRITEVDPTGAGDAFGGAFVGCLVKQFPIEKSLKLACAAGALAVSRKGPMEGVMSLKEIETFIATASTL